jgi:hypothetical protein
MNTLKLFATIGALALCGCGGGSSPSGNKQISTISLNTYLGSYQGTFHSPEYSGTISMTINSTGNLSATLAPLSWTTGENTLQGAVSTGGAVNATYATATGTQPVQGSLTLTGNKLTGTIGNLSIVCVQQ